jgi:hypothetical protein
LAKVTFGAIASSARGKIAGIVYSRNQNGFYVRAKGTVTNEPSTRRTFVRDNVTDLAAAWNETLSDTDRESWREFGKFHSIAREQPGGRNDAGREAFFSLNGKLLNAGETLITTPPSNLEVTPLVALGASATAGTPGTAEISFTPGTVPANHLLEIWATAPANPGRNSFTGMWRWLCALPPGETSPSNITTEYAARFGNVTGPNAYGFAAALIKTTTGSRSQRLELRTTTT